MQTWWPFLIYPKHQRNTFGYGVLLCMLWTTTSSTHEALTYKGQARSVAIAGWSERITQQGISHNLSTNLQLIPNTTWISHVIYPLCSLAQIHSAESDLTTVSIKRADHLAGLDWRGVQVRSSEPHNIDIRCYGSIVMQHILTDFLYCHFVVVRHVAWWLMSLLQKS